MWSNQTKISSAKISHLAIFTLFHSWIFTYSFCKFISLFLSNLHTPRGDQTDNPEIKSHILFWWWAGGVVQRFTVLLFFKFKDTNSNSEWWHRVTKNEVTQVLFLLLYDHFDCELMVYTQESVIPKGMKIGTAHEASLNDSALLWIHKMKMGIWVRECLGSNCLTGGFSN